MDFKNWLRSIGRRIVNYVGPEYVGMSVKNWLNMADYGAVTDAGIYVDAEIAKKASTIFACIRILGDGCSCSPRQIFDRTGPINRELNTKHPQYRKLHDEPNPLMSAATFFKTLVGHFYLHGDAIVWLARNRGGEIQDYFLLDPRDVDVDKVNGRLTYTVKTVENGYRTFDQADIIHIPNMFMEIRDAAPRRYRGMSTITAGAQPIGLSLAAEKHTASYLKNGVMSNVVFSYPGKMGSDLLRKQVEFLRGQYGGGNKGTPIVLSDGGDVKSIVIDAEKAQLLQSREFSVIDIGCRLFGLPPHLIGAVEKQTSWGSGVEQMGIAMVVFTLNPLINLIEQEFNRKVFRDGKSFLEFNLDGLVRGDMKAQNEAFQIALGGNQMPGWMSVNEIRKLKNLPPVEGGDKCYDPPKYDKRQEDRRQDQSGDTDESETAA